MTSKNRPATQGMMTARGSDDRGVATRTFEEPPRNAGDDDLVY